MTRRRVLSSADQPELFGWAPPEPVIAFEPKRVKAASLASEMSRAISEALSDSTAPREEIAQRMTSYLGQPVSAAMLDKYSSEAAEDHIMNVVRFVALIEATGDRRLLQHIADRFDWLVIEARYLPAIRYAQKIERRAELDKDIEFDRRQMKSGGII